MPPFWFWPLMLFLALGFWSLTWSDRKTGRLGRWSRRLGFSSSERVGFDFSHYFDLRRQGLEHKDAIKELQRMWDDGPGKKYE